MATIKVFSSKGVKELQCFDTLVDVDYLPVEAADPVSDPEELSEE